ncbi:unnamed protein product [Amoebophrya sp. A120]|nr:unnamed protein product [Amoebophrya sp. A120]|eukprot:GSA120T00013888001.1
MVGQLTNLLCLASVYLLHFISSRDITSGGLQHASFQSWRGKINHEINQLSTTTGRASLVPSKRASTEPALKKLHTTVLRRDEDDEAQLVSPTASNGLGTPTVGVYGRDVGKRKNTEPAQNPQEIRSAPGTTSSTSEKRIRVKNRPDEQTELHADPFLLSHWFQKAEQISEDPKVYKLHVKRFEDLPLARLPRQWHAAQTQQDYFFDEEIFKRKKNGFYIECGASDGFLHSNTLFFERIRNWQGLLVEASKIEFEQIVNAGLRKPENNVYFNGCLTDFEKSGKLLTYVDRSEWTSGLGVVSDRTAAEAAEHNSQYNSRDRVVSVPCVSLTDLFAKGIEKQFPERLNRIQYGQEAVVKIDLFSLDVEGNELEVLKGIDFTRYKIDYFLIEYAPPPYYERSDGSSSGSNPTDLKLKRKADLENFFHEQVYLKYGSVRYETLALLGGKECGSRGVYWVVPPGGGGSAAGAVGGIPTGPRLRNPVPLHLQTTEILRCQDIVFRRILSTLPVKIPPEPHQTARCSVRGLCEGHKLAEASGKTS